MYTIRN